MILRHLATTMVCLLPFSVAVAQAPAPAPSARPAAATNPQALCLVVKFKAKPGKNAEMEAAFKEMQAAVRANEPGNAQYDFFVMANDPQTYVIIERYKDQAAMQAHGASEHGKKLIAALRDLTDGPAQAERFVLISAK
jgi:quinol monooxygenase YgiN